MLSAHLDALRMAKLGEAPQAETQLSRPLLFHHVRGDEQVYIGQPHTAAYLTGEGQDKEAAYKRKAKKFVYFPPLNIITFNVRFVIAPSSTKYHRRTRYRHLRRGVTTATACQNTPGGYLEEFGDFVISHKYCIPPRRRTGRRCI